MNRKFSIGMFCILLCLTGFAGYLSYTYIEKEKQSVAVKRTETVEPREKIEDSTVKGEEVNASAGTNEDVKKKTEEVSEKEKESKEVEKENTEAQSSKDNNQTVADVMKEEVSQPKKTIQKNDNYEVPKDKLNHIQNVIDKVNPSADSSEGNKNDQVSNSENKTEDTTTKPNKPSLPTKPPVIFERNYMTTFVQSLKKDSAIVSTNEAEDKKFQNEVCYKLTVKSEANQDETYNCWIGGNTLKIYDEDGVVLGTIYNDFGQLFQ